ncbi:MAG: methyltransferase [Rhodospirillaceae bacterium]|nr:methyltransferase [Rhodospirillaceae bacterium]
MTTEAKPSPTAALMKITGQIPLIRSLGLAAELGLADLLAERPQTATQLAQRCGAHAESLYRMLRYMASHGYFREDDAGTFHNTDLSDVLREAAPGSMRAWVRTAWQDVIWDTYRHFPHTIATGEPAFTKAHGQDFFDYLARHQDVGARFDQVMARQSGPENTGVANAYPFADAKTVMDVGGGRGGFLATLLRTYPKLRGALFEQAHVLKQADALRTPELAGRYELVAGNFFDAVPTGADIYTLKRVLHDWPDETALKILSNARAALGPKARVLVIDAVIKPGNEPDPNKALDVGIMALTPGRERTAADFQRLFAAAGLKLLRIIPTAAPSTMSIVEGAAT